MNGLRCLLLAAAMLQGVPVFAPAAEVSPLAGHWVLDVATLPMPPAERPKSVTLDFRRAESGRWWSHVAIVDQKGGTMASESTLALDGTPGQAVGNYWVDVCSAKMPAPNVLVMQFGYKGNPASTRVYSVSADGNALTETEAYFKNEGTPVLRTAIFNRKSREVGETP